MSRFDYVKFDEMSVRDQAEAKKACEELERVIEMILPHPGRAKSLALTKLEEVYMWIGKAVRDDQIARGGPAILQEERKDS
ncbi:hypothetical protein UFOVP558_24 [uncultured Caudovirales phage]|uniref:Acb2/Tad1 hairpin domain-containing protein n=1 Tax=uncultured Caudovirales phage TaxID=2100421 RepID=A0A6J5MUR0_9CAUD|nr:hypothetical protein UFOVP558_24 [uncultured Caudovirales phage]